MVLLKKGITMQSELVQVWLDTNRTINLPCVIEGSEIKIYDYQKNELRINKFKETVFYANKECPYFLIESRSHPSDDDFLDSLPEIK